MYQIDGISIDKLYTQFQRDNILESTTQGWDKFKLLDGFYDFIKTSWELTSCKTRKFDFLKD